MPKISTIIPHRYQGALSLVLVTIVWGTTFPAMKDLITDFSPIWLVLIRFTFAAVLLSPFLLRAKKSDFIAGISLGVVLLICYMFQLEGLHLTSANRNAFVIGLNVLFVPLFGILFGKLPERRLDLVGAGALAHAEDLIVIAFCIRHAHCFSN